jgi:glycosyltransferase involved in cell wall biosynthesis
MLALSPVPEEGAGCRFRIAQYVPALEAAGIRVSISPFFTRDFFGLVYRKGHYVRKAVLFGRRALDRLRSLSLRRHFDIIYIYREAFPVGPAIIESLLARTPGVAMIYDFDDAVYLPNTSDANRAIAALKWPGKVKSIVRLSDGVIAGNAYLAEWARHSSDAVRVIPTCVDTDKFVPRSNAGGAGSNAAAPIVGWIGTPTTAPYLLSLQPILQEVARAHPFVLRVCGAGSDVRMPGVSVENVPWTLDAEVSLFNTCDVGVYPLSDDEWARGKCGFKAIQFMACGVPVVAAPVGVNRDIIQDGRNGLLASTPAEWVEKLGRLLADASLRAGLGAAGRATIEAEYSLKANAPKMVKAVHDAVERARHRAPRHARVAVGAPRP